MNATCIACAATLAAILPFACSATEVTIANVSFERVAVFAVDYGNYHAGDWQLVLSYPNAPPPLPASLRCADSVRFTTKRVNDPKRRMLESAKQVQLQLGAKGSITISDDPLRQAAPGQCSILAISH